ncbi:death effector domain-containing protein-like [Mya arenaria]|uniref:death effector domain-containing protein-like n=1 Tax=Mya arenaria TaxID=6604 RepID=UPI0022E8CBC3|nr:death effector domain-containing protein-like [Mya arenaria]
MASPMEQKQNYNDIVTKLHNMFEHLSKNMSVKDTDDCKMHFFLSPHFSTKGSRSNGIDLPRKMYQCDARTFLKFLESKGIVDDSNIGPIVDNLRKYNPQIAELATLERRKKVEVDPVVDYLERTCPRQVDDFLPKGLIPSRCSERIRKRKSCHMQDARDKGAAKRQAIFTNCSKARAFNLHSKEVFDVACSSSNVPVDRSICVHPIRETCDVKLRVKYEYQDHQEILDANVHSHKPHEMARKMDKFNQASTILKARDLGAVVCEIKFSEITSLDAFWRDYVNGSLLQALKGVFITEALQQVVGEEPMRLLVTVDEDDYRRGRLKQLKNLTS